MPQAEPILHPRVIETLASRPLTMHKGAAAITAAGDKIFRDGSFNCRIAEAVLKHHCPVIYADDVLPEVHGVEDTAAIISDTPGVMLPFRSCWVEGCLWGGSPENDFQHAAAFCQMHGADEGPTMKAAAAMEDLTGKPPYQSLVLFNYVRQSNGVAVGPIAMTTVWVDEDYRVMTGHHVKPEKRAELRGQKRLSEKADLAGLPLGTLKFLVWPAGYGKGDVGFLQATSLLTLAMVVRTVGLLNCSNVQMVEAGHTNERVPREHRERQHLAWVKYHVLKVKVGGELREIRQKDPNAYGPGVALHTVRGHFRDYSSGAGLFGKYRKPAVWVPQHVRGDAEHGVLVKDYKLTQENGAGQGT